MLQLTDDMMKGMKVAPPRVMIAAPHGRSGKTVVTVGLCALLRKMGLAVQPFKKGPDYIDASWLSAASGHVCRNLDAYLMTGEALRNNFARSVLTSDFVIIEGNMGLYDGIDGGGEGSSAHLARLLKTPIVLVVDTARMTRSVAALVKGFMDFEEGTAVAGVILNNIAGPRHERKLTDAVERYCKIPVLGRISRNQSLCIDERHLGLVPFREATAGALAIERVLRSIEKQIDVDVLFAIAKTAVPFPSGSSAVETEGQPVIRIGVILDRAFHFYYPENLEALEREGAELVFIDSMRDQSLPYIDGLYIGGGFPELYLEAIERNSTLRECIASSLENGLPAYAECAGLMYLCEKIVLGENSYRGVGVLPLAVEFQKRPQAHGYVHAEVKYENPFYPVGTMIRGHEFHHSRIASVKGLHCALELTRGQGISGKLDGIVYRNVFASYTHVHASGTPGWAKSFVSAALRWREGNKATKPNSPSEEVGNG